MIAVVFPGVFGVFHLTCWLFCLIALLFYSCFGSCCSFWVCDFGVLVVLDLLCDCEYGGLI